MERKSRAGVIKWIRWPLIMAASIGLVLLVSVSAGRETYHQWQVDQQIKGLQMQAETLEGKRVHLLDTIQKLGSLDELDKEARLRLDLKKPGESVYVLQGVDVNPAQNTSVAVASAARTGPVRSNPRKWFDYFFVHSSVQ